MKSTKMNNNNESIWQTALKPVLISKYDSVKFAELVIVVCCFKQIKFFSSKKFFRVFKFFENLFWYIVLQNKPVYFCFYFSFYLFQRLWDIAE